MRPTASTPGGIMRVVVDFDRCQSNAVCMDVAPEIFEVRDDNFLYILKETPGRRAAPQAGEAVRRCPTQAISIEEDWLLRSVRVPTLDRIVVVGASLAGLSALEALRQAAYEGELVARRGRGHLPYDRPPLSKQVLPAPGSRSRPSCVTPPTTTRWRSTGTSGAGLPPSTWTGGLWCSTTASRWPSTGWSSPPGPRPAPCRVRPPWLASRAAHDGGLPGPAQGAGGRPRVCVVGGGFIGAEVAASCRSRGLEVTIVEALPAPLARAFPAEMGAACAALHRDHGVDVRTSVGVEGLDGSGRVERVRLAGGRLRGR